VTAARDAVLVSALSIAARTKRRMKGICARIVHQSLAHV
jgi:hypothetical protein